MSGPRPASEVIRNFVELLRKSHLLMADGRGESPEADALRDQMDGPWYAMSTDEIERAGGLSADLYSLCDDEVMHPDSVGKTVSEDELESAWVGHDWDRTLELLRLQPAFLTRDQIAFMRGYRRLMFGELEIARHFFEKSIELAPDNPGYRTILAHVLVQLDRIEQAQAIIGDLTKDTECASPLEMLRAGGVQFAAASKLTPSERAAAEAELSRFLLNILQGHFKGNEIPPKERSRYMVMVGICQDDLGNSNEALEAFTEAA